MTRRERSIGDALAQGLRSPWVIGLLVLLAVVSLGQGMLNALEDARSQDAPYSHARYLLQGLNPYAVYLAKGTGAFLLAQMPSYLPSIYLAVLPVAALPWETAKVVWMLLNLSLCLVMAVWLYQRVENRRMGLALALVFLSALPVRAAISNGQPIVLVTFCIVLALRLRVGWLQGALLAIGSAKYSVGPFFVAVLLGARRWVVVGSVIAVVLLAYALVAVVSGSAFDLALLTAPLAVNRKAFAVYAPFEQIRSLFGFTALMIIPAAGLLLCTLVSARARPRWTAGFEDPTNQRLLLLATLSCLSLAPHGDYDLILLVVPFLFFDPFRVLSSAQRRALGVALLYSWNLRKLLKFLPMPVQDAALSIAIALMLFVALGLVRDLWAGRARDAANLPDA